MAVGVDQPIVCDSERDLNCHNRSTILFSHVTPKMPEFTSHETKSVKEYLSDLQAFIDKRLGSSVKLAIPQLGNSEITSKDELVSQLKNEGYTSCDWLSRRLTAPEVDEALQEMALLHAAGLAYRTSMKKGLEDVYPWLEQDIYTSYQTKELLAKYLDSYLHYLSSLPGLDRPVHVLRKFKSRIFHLLVTLRRPVDSLGRRFRTVCHGDLWMGSLMFKKSKDKVDCAIIDFHSTGYLSPVCDLAHLMLTSTEKEYMLENWESIVESYYSAFSYNLANLGLVLRHLGTNKHHFNQEVRRALAGEILCLAVVTPIMVMCGPKEKRRCRRKRSSSERENTVRHLIQMMAIAEEMETDGDEAEEEAERVREYHGEWAALHKDERLRGSIVDLLTIADQLGVMDELYVWAPVNSVPRHRKRTNTI